MFRLRTSEGVALTEDAVPGGVLRELLRGRTAFESGALVKLLKGPSIKDVRSKLGLFDPLPLLSEL